MKTVHSLLAVSLATVAALSLTGCAAMPKLAWFSRDKAPAIRPVATAVEAQGPALSLADRLYPTAVAELRARRYGRAIELLQAARDSSPGDARVLNALGVAYDKLGRFDLSGRYYDLALKADPASPLVQANMRYSARLQGRGMELASASPAAEPVTTEAPVQPAATQPATIRLAVGTASVRTQPLLTGASLVIADGSGKAGAADRVRGELAAHGWSVARNVQNNSPRATAEISFPSQQQAAAAALARTLPFATKLAACTDGCAGLKLTIGADSRWIR